MQALNGAGTALIRGFVERGGSYLARTPLPPPFPSLLLLRRGRRAHIESFFSHTVTTARSLSPLFPPSLPAAAQGLCAGAYFASAFCDFERGHPTLEARLPTLPLPIPIPILPTLPNLPALLPTARAQVVGPRELAFFPGSALGAVVPGFHYATQARTRLGTRMGTWGF